jgi:broad specificity phosphatase PhoE
MARSGPAILLIRHGETEWSRSGQHTGRTDIPLTSAGVESAEALGRRLTGRDLALVLTSPMIRARETQRLVGVGEHVEITEDLHELDYGEYEGLTTMQVRETRTGWDLWADGAPGGESLAAAGQRADRVIERALDAGGDVALFAHGHILRILGARWIGLPPEAGGGLALGTAALCDLGFERERHVIWLWNDTSHWA